MVEEVLRRLGFSVAIAVVAGLGTGFALYRPITVSGHSMAPTLESGDQLLVTRSIWPQRPIERGDLVVFRDPSGSGSLLIKRVVSLEGETVFAPLSPYAESDFLKHKAYVVPKGSYYLLGDNLSASMDSRLYGAVEASDIVGRVVPIPWQFMGGSMLGILWSSLAALSLSAGTFFLHLPPRHDRSPR